ncbi:MAG: FHA domain-containing protein [Gammaproteobacteria bacterium]
MHPIGASIGAGTRSGHPSTETTLVDGPSRKPLIQSIELWVIAGPDAGLQKRRDLSGTPVVRVGRNMDNDLVLSDPYVSRLHLELQTMPEGLVLVDRSSGGIFIGDWRVKEMYLVGPETLCRLGQSRLLLRQAIERQAEGDHRPPERLGGNERSHAGAVQAPLQGSTCRRDGAVDGGDRSG